MSRLVIGILSFRPRGMSLETGEDRRLVLVEADLANQVRRRGFEVIPGGAPYPEEDQYADTASLARRHIHTLMDFDPAAVILNVGSGGNPGVVTSTVKYLERELKSPPRLLVFGDPIRQPGAGEVVQNLAAHLLQFGFPSLRHIGAISSPGDMDEMAKKLEHLRQRYDAGTTMVELIHRLKRQCFLVIGAQHAPIHAGFLNAETVLRDFGVAVDQVAVDELRQLLHNIRSEHGGRSLDPRLLAAIKSGSSTDDLVILTRALAVTDLARSCEATLVGLADSSPDDRAVLALLAARQYPWGEVKEALAASSGIDLETAVLQWTADQFLKRAVFPAKLIDQTASAWILETGCGVQAGPGTWLSCAFFRGRRVIRAVEGDIEPRSGASVVFKTPGVPLPAIPPYFKSAGVLAPGDLAAPIFEWAHRLNFEFSGQTRSGLTIES